MLFRKRVAVVSSFMNHRAMLFVRWCVVLLFAKLVDGLPTDS